MNKFAAVYIRVSTDAQREDGYSIDAQKEMLTAYCVSKGIKNYEYYIDGGFSGSNIDRPELKRLIDDVKLGKISCVLVYKLDRLSRSQKDTLFLIEDVFNPNQVDFISLNESMDTSTPLGRLMLGILSAFAQLERENIKERTSMGMKERIKSGYWMGGGRVPFGYDYDVGQGILVPNRDAETVRKVFELYLSGYSTTSIARMLNLSYERMARQILKRKTYTGVIVYNGEEFQGRHKPIINLDTYERAMQRMEERSGKFRGTNENLLTGLVVCEKCGAKMRYQRWGNQGYKLMCYSRDKSKPHLVRDPDCTNLGVWANELESIVLEDLFSVGLKTVSVKEVSEKSVLEVLQDNEKKFTDKLKRLYSLYAESDNEILKETIEDTQKALENLKKQIERETSRQIISRRNKEIKKQLVTLRESWEYMTPKEKKNIIDSCVSKIVASENNVEIYYKFL